MPNCDQIEMDLCHHAGVILQKLYYEVNKTELDIAFLIKCREHNINHGTKASKELIIFQ